MQYVLHPANAVFSLRHAPSWLLLTAASGMVNGLAFLACAQYVTHVTGTATRLGLEAPHAGVALEYAVVVLSFIAGAACSVLPLQFRVLRGKRPLWAVPLVVVAAVMVVVALLGPVGAFGPFGGEAVANDPPFALLWLLAFATGLQNAAVATSTGLVVRSTHLTGPATDLGVHLGLTFFARGEERHTAIRGAALRGAKVIAFVTGAAVALPLAGAVGYLAYLVPAACVLVATGLSFVPTWDKTEAKSAASTDSDQNRRSRAARRSTWPSANASL